MDPAHTTAVPPPVSVGIDRKRERHVPTLTLLGSMFLLLVSIL